MTQAFLRVIKPSQLSSVSSKKPIPALLKVGLKTLNYPLPHKQDWQLGGGKSIEILKGYQKQEEHALFWSLKGGQVAVQKKRQKA